MAGGFYKILDQSGNFRKEVRIQEQKLSQRYPKRMLNGRQVFFMMIEHFKTNEAADGMHDFEMILATELRGDNLDDFQRTWDMVMLRVVSRPAEEQLEVLHRKQVRKSNQFYQTWSLYNYNVMHNKQPRSYNTLHKMVGDHLREKLKQKHTVAIKDGKPKWAFPAEGGDGKPGRIQGECFAWIQHGQCNNPDKCPYTHPKVSKQKEKVRDFPPLKEVGKEKEIGEVKERDLGKEKVKENDRGKEEAAGKESCHGKEKEKDKDHGKVKEKGKGAKVGGPQIVLPRWLLQQLRILDLQVPNVEDAHLQEKRTNHIVDISRRVLVLRGINVNVGTLVLAERSKRVAVKPAGAAHFSTLRAPHQLKLKEKPSVKVKENKEKEMQHMSIVFFQSPPSVCKPMHPL